MAKYTHQSHHKGEPYKIPDYRIYKVEDIPELVRTKNALASHGLKDPWLRNEVWRYDPKQWGTPSQRHRLMWLRGFKVGFAAFVVTIVGTEVYNRLFPDEHHEQPCEK